MVSMTDWLTFRDGYDDAAKYAASCTARTTRTPDMIRKARRMVNGSIPYLAGAYYPDALPPALYETTQSTEGK